MALGSQRHLFAIPDEVAYLNTAYMGPLPCVSVEAGVEALRRKSVPWQIPISEFFEPVERMRGAVAEVLGADVEGVALVPSVSYGVALAAKNIRLEPGEEIVVLEDEFPSNVYVWRDLAERREGWVHTVPRPDDDDWTTALLDRLDRDGDEVRVVATAPCHWTDGTLVDLEAVGRRCRDIGAALVVDTCQSLGAMPLDVGAVQPDVVVGACYKWLLGPYTVGFCWLAPHLRSGRPLEHNWITRAGSEDFAGLVDYVDEYRPGARRYDMGEVADFALIPAATASLELIASWGVEAVAEHAGALTDAAVTGAEALGFDAPPAGLRSRHLVGLRRAGLDRERLLAELAAEQVHVSVRGDAVRVSAHVFNTPDDVARLLAALARAVD